MDLEEDSEQDWGVEGNRSEDRRGFGSESGRREEKRGEERTRFL